jgi:thioesterase domain-containing protein
VRPAELEQYLHSHIPLTKAMAVAVHSVSEEAVILTAPLAPNTNHRDTVFGGSASALALLAGWSLLHVRLEALGTPNRLVIQRSTMDYDEPIAGAFTARASLAQPLEWPRFMAMLARRGRARLEVCAVLEHAGRVAGRFTGEFVALRPEHGAVSEGESRA